MSNLYSSSSSVVRPPREPPTGVDRTRFNDYAIERTTETAGDFSTLGSFQHQQQQAKSGSTASAVPYDTAVAGHPPPQVSDTASTKKGASGVPTESGIAHGARRGTEGAEEDHKLPHWRLFIEHWHATIAYCAVFWSFGMCVAFLGPTLLDLGCQTSSDMRAVSWVFVAQLFCSLAGATVAGYLARRFDANRILLVNTAVLPICMFMIPMCKALTSLAFILAIMGLNMGCIDCLANLQMINIHGIGVAPFLHALHFCYGVGAFVSPLIAEPFLLNEDCSPFIDNDTSAISVAAAELRLLAPPGSIPLNDTNLPADTLYEAQEMTRVRYAFWIMALVQMPIPVMIGSLSFKLQLRGWRLGHHQLTRVESDLSMSTTKGGHVPNEPSSTAAGAAPCAAARQHQHQQNFPVGSEYGSVGKEWASSVPVGLPAGATSNGQHGGLPDFLASEHRQMIAIAGLTAALLFIYDGLQSTYGGYVYSFAVKSIVNLNKTEGAYLNALFWGMFALGRLLSIPLATKFTPAFMLLCNIMGCLLSMTFMLLIRHNHVVLYVGTAIFGVFLSSVAPTAISLAELYIDVTSSVTSVIVVVAALGEMICPVIVGTTFVTLGPASFLGFSDLMCFASVAVFAALWYIGRRTPKHQATGENDSFVWCRMCCIRQPHGGLPAQVQHVRYLRKFESRDSSNIEMNVVNG